ncbi:F0F1 ATP synthase subunit epsilon [Vagococcus salmoninarum]|uniref:ATP synthase epsilon chain n=1 Tax=Vagococcus salmoninarum TaxID=2739 RepID=A0A429ZMQ8_9ENTE|nr:F0F1 ATP synthase subunit epsilon [Vagococcus salmoninarum]MBE9389476.1 F0F1 ATP synthase subunit epsilon [Vagococcus salmoninarum]RST94987.1 F0F1 ATP synthase subunit epsilon [Vagococcus salmoninarum]
MAKLKVEVVTPNGLSYTNQAAQLVVVRTVDGDLGIMPNHAPIIVPLKIDEVRVKNSRDSSEQDIIAINGGIMEVRDNVVTIIADSAEKPSEIDVLRAEKAKERAEATIEEAKKEHDIDQLKRAEVALSRAINRINVSRK